MNKSLWMTVLMAGLVVSGCSSNHSTPVGSTTPSGGSEPPTDFAAFVNQQVQTRPAFGSTPAVTSVLTTDLGLGDATAFASVTFGSGDALPTGTNQASVACTQAGKTACNPASSADLNSNLN